MEKATVHSIVVTNAAGENLPLATGDVGVLEDEDGVPLRLSFTPQNGLPVDGEPLAITFAAPAEAPQGMVDNLVFKGLADNVAEFHDPRERAMVGATVIPTIPGAAVVGWGFNIFGRYDETSKIRQLFDLGTPKVEQIGGRDYEVPSGTSVGTGGSFEGSSSFYSSREAYQSSLSTKASVKGSYGAFSGEFSAEYSSVGKRENEYQYLVFDAARNTWLLSLNEPTISKVLPSVKSDPDFVNLPKTYIPPQGSNPGNGQLFFRFFKKFGTHFVGTVDMGGSLVYNAYISKSYKYDEDTANAKATLEYNAIFLKTKGEAAAYWKSVGEKWTQDRKVSVRGVGGTTPLIVVDPMYGENINEKFEAWLASLPESPKAVGFTLTPISQLFSGDQASAVEQAFEAYGNSRVYTASSFLLKPPPVEPTLIISGNPIKYTPDAKQEDHPVYWAVVMDRSTLQVVFNQAFVLDARYKSYQEYFAAIHAKLNPFNDKKHILALTTANMWVLAVAQGELYRLLLACGGGSQLKQVEEWALKQDSTNHGCIVYSLLGVMGSGPDSGVEAMASAPSSSYQKLLTCELYKPLLPDTDNTGQIVWTPET